MWSWAYFSSSGECLWHLFRSAFAAVSVSSQVFRCAACWYSSSTVCSAKFASRTPFWALLVPGHVAGLITVEVQAAQVGEAEVVRRVVDFVGFSGSGRKRSRLNTKT